MLYSDPFIKYLQAYNSSTNKSNLSLIYSSASEWEKRPHEKISKTDRYRMDARHQGVRKKRMRQTFTNKCRVKAGNESEGKQGHVVRAVTSLLTLA